MTIRSALIAAATNIARRDAETLLAHILCRDRAYLLANPEAELAPAQLAALQTMTIRRAAHEPLQHLTGRQEFFGLTLRVTPNTLIPRPETELLVEAVLHCITDFATASPLRILDIGTGSGAIALALASRLPHAQVTAVDLSPAALEVARGNADSLGLAGRIRFMQSDLLSAIAPEERFDVIVSNPPYVALTDAPTLAPEVIDYEPHTALFAGLDGLAIYRRLVPAAHAALASHGLLALEFGFGQREGLRALLEATPSAWHSIRFLDDYAGIPRVALAQRSAN